MNYKEEVLSNNLRILFLEKSDSPLSAMLLFVNCGVRNEDEKGGARNTKMIWHWE